MFSADNSGLIIVWGTKVVPGSHRALTSQWSIERVTEFSNTTLEELYKSQFEIMI